MDHSLSVESVTLGVMILATMLTVFAGWNKTTERITRLEERFNIIIKKLSPSRRSEDREEEDIDE